MEWISVKEKIPTVKTWPDIPDFKTSEDVLIYYTSAHNQHSYIEIGTFSKNKGHKGKWTTMLGDAALPVTHWMPLPKPPHNQ